MDIHRETIGTTAGHAEQAPTTVDAYTLDTGKGLAITVWTYGATLIEVLVPDRGGHVDNVVVRLPDLVSYEDRTKNPYLGATLGRYARCIAGGRLRLDELDYQLDCNYGRHHIHGGPIGFDRFVWDADAERKADQVSLRLRLDRPDGDQGYPGALSAVTFYRVHSDGRLTFEYRATTTASTVVALTNHAYWNLAGSGTINDHRLVLNAARVVLVDDELIPVGSPVGVADIRLDYSTPRPIADDQLDNCFVLDDPTWAAELFDPASGRVMRVLTDQPGVQVYSADGFTEPRAGLCLQTGAWPDSPNHADYPPSRLDPGTTYRHHTTHEFSIR
jgi:aldose 1-epimerase